MLRPRMTTFLVVLQMLTAILLIGLILIHSAKGEGLGGIGGEARLFGSTRGLEEGLDRVTTIMAGIFVGLALILYLMST